MAVEVDDLRWQWRVAEETKPSFMGASPAFLMGCRKAGLHPGRDYDLSSIREWLHGEGGVRM